MADVTFLNLLRGNRISGFLRLKMSPGVAYRMATDYTYAEVALNNVQNMEGENLAMSAELKIQRNQQVELVAPCSLQPIAGHKALIVANPALFRYASVPPMLLVDSLQQPAEVVIPAKFHRDMAISELDWLCRIYLIN